MVIGSPKGTSKDGSGLEDLWEATKDAIISQLLFKDRSKIIR